MDRDIPNNDLLRYFDKQMNASEQQLFEKKLEDDPLLKQELEKLQLLNNAIKYYSINSQVNEIRKLYEVQGHLNEKVDTGKAKVFKMSKALRVSIIAAASIILVLSGAVTYTIYQLSPGKVFNESYVSYNINSSRSSQNRNTRIEDAYSNGDFNTVIKLSDESPLTYQDELLKGISYMQLNLLPDAIIQFNRILNEKESNFKQDAEYYLALTYIKDNDYKNALPLLIKIRENKSHLYHNQVTQKIIREVKLLKWKQ
jgi:hypothetical protein